jgi:hypothetical protein
MAATWPAEPDALAEPAVEAPRIEPTKVRARDIGARATLVCDRLLPRAEASPPTRLEWIEPVEFAACDPQPSETALFDPLEATAVALPEILTLPEGPARAGMA